MSAARDLLDLPLPECQEGFRTVREYLTVLLARFMTGEADAKYGMSGESDWRYDLYGPMINAGLLPGRDHYENDGYGIDARESADLDRQLAAAARELQ